MDWPVACDVSTLRHWGRLQSHHWQKEVAFWVTPTLIDCLCVI